MPTAFISYRRADARESALRIYDRLVRDLGERRVFIDLYGIDAGTDFVERLDRALDHCDVCVVVIGTSWMSRSAGMSDGNKDVDYVHLEVSRAIAKGVRLLPVLVNGAVMPADRERRSDASYQCEPASRDDAIAVVPLE